MSFIQWYVLIYVVLILVSGLIMDGQFRPAGEYKFKYIFIQLLVLSPILIAAYYRSF